MQRAEAVSAQGGDGLGDPDGKVDAKAQNKGQSLGPGGHVHCLGEESSDKKGTFVVELVGLAVKARGAASSLKHDAKERRRARSRFGRELSHPPFKIRVEDRVGGVERGWSGIPKSTPALPKEALNWGERVQAPSTR